MSPPRAAVPFSEAQTEMHRLHNRLLIEVTAVVGVAAALLRLSLG